MQRKVGGLFKGAASWYGEKFHGRRTASGQIYDQNKFTCAHRTLPFGTSILVVNPFNGEECTVVVTDRGPHCKSRVIDLSKAPVEAAKPPVETAKVSVESSKVPASL